MTLICWGTTVPVSSPARRTRPDPGAGRFTLTRRSKSVSPSYISFSRVSPATPKVGFLPEIFLTDWWIFCSQETGRSSSRRRRSTRGWRWTCATHPTSPAPAWPTVARSPAVCRDIPTRLVVIISAPDNHQTSPLTSDAAVAVHLHPQPGGLPGRGCPVSLHPGLQVPQRLCLPRRGCQWRGGSQ